MESVHVEDELQYDQLVCQLEQSLLKQNTEFNNIKFDLTKISSIRFLHSLIEKLTIRLSHANIVQYTEWIKPIIISAYEANQQNSSVTLHELIRPYLHLRLNPHNAVKCHNVCVLLIMLQEFSNFVTQLPVQPVYTFLMHNLFSVKTFFNDPQRMINLFVVIDRMILSQEHKTHLLESEPSLLATLWWCADLYGQSDCVTRLVYQQSNNEKITYMHLQVGFCARWFLERILLGQTLSRNLSSRQQKATLNREDKSKHLKLSHDCLSARSDWSWQYVRSTCAVNSGVHYYEVVLITGGPMRIGWTYTTSKRTSLVADKVNEEIFTIAFNGHGKCVYRKKRERFNKITQEQNIRVPVNFPWLPLVKPGDVVGCLINFDKFKFDFYLNGDLIPLHNVYKYIPEGQQSYHASISLYEHQQCYCNFGQTNFKYPPKGVKFQCFYNNDDHAINLNHIESKSEPRWYEFKDDILTYDRVERLFENDEKQAQIDELVKQIEQNIHSKQPLVIDLSKEYECLRMIQSIVERIGTLLSSKLDILINWTDQYLIRHLTDNANPYFPDLICQVLYPYFQLHLTHDTIITHRNVCAMLCLLSSVIMDLNIRIHLHKQIITYLCSILTKYFDQLIMDEDQENDDNPMNDEWILLLVIVTLGNLDLDDATKKAICGNRKLFKVLEAHNYTTYVDENYKVSKYLLFQSQFCTQWFLNKVLRRKTSSTTEGQMVPVEKPTKLSSTDCSPKVKLSPDRLVARSDSNWQSVRSNCCTKKAIYYEVTLHTNGPMRIGWATGQTYLNQNPIGTDRHSIGYDGYNRLVWHNNVAYPVTHNIPQWVAGDIVGCLITRREFVFYLKECAIEFPRLIEVHYSSRPYFAAASLSTMQQCSFNFTKTFYHWRRPSSNNFDSIRRIKLTNFYKRIQKMLKPINLNNAIFADGNAQFQFHGKFQMIYNECSANSTKASCSTESTGSASTEEMSLSSSVNEQMFSEIMEEECEEDVKIDDAEIEDIFEMINGVSEA